jgi:hypothetical protein
MTDVDDLWDNIPAGPDRDEPDCTDCMDSGTVDDTPWCPTCHPSPRHARRARHRMWQHRDRASRPPGHPAPNIDDRLVF